MFSLECAKSAVSRVSSLFVFPCSPSRQISKNAVWFFSDGSDFWCWCCPWGCGYSSQNWSVSKVLAAASWRSNSVFVSFLLM